MIHEKLKKLIFRKLYKDLSKVEIIPYQDSIWFINREKSYWYLEYKQRGDLWWRYNFFDSFFSVFSLERKEYEPLICEWVEEVLNCKVVTPSKQSFTACALVEEVLNRKVVTSDTGWDSIGVLVEEVLNLKVIKPIITNIEPDEMVEEVLNCNITKPFSLPFMERRGIEDVLNYKVIKPHRTIGDAITTVVKVLNYEVVSLSDNHE
jgi:hypothetical protein